MGKVCVIGHFGFGQSLLNGQTIKTKIITAEIERCCGKTNVIRLDLAGGAKKIPGLLIKIPKALSECDNIAIFPVENGLRFLTPVLNFWNLFFKKKIHYIVIGGWLPGFVSDKYLLKKGVKSFDGIYVETNTMKKALEEQGFTNIFVMPNCKPLKILSENELVYPEGIPYKLCTFSRVMKEKGIETAVYAIRNVNRQMGYTAYSLDIYGQIDANQTEWFADLQSRFPDYIHYGGCVDADKSVEVLRDYFALLFPTHFYTEGIPGTIVDAYAAGVPVISARWESFADVIDDGKTGIGYEFDHEEDLEKILLSVANNPQIVLDMRTNCIRGARKYLPEAALQCINEKFLGGGVTYKLYPLRLCTFSRVMKEKGIGDAVNAVKQINEQAGKTVYVLDIYGQTDKNQREWFDDLQAAFPRHIRYCGLVPFDKSTEVLKEYFALLFPTCYKGEGFAGTLLDAYSAGLPVIASDWKYNAELVTDRVGYTYPTGDQARFIEILKEIAVNPSLILQKKKLCILEAREYRIEKVTRVLIDRMES